MSEDLQTSMREYDARILEILNVVPMDYDTNEYPIGFDGVVADEDLLTEGEYSDDEGPESAIPTNESTTESNEGTITEGDYIEDDVEFDADIVFAETVNPLVSDVVRRVNAAQECDRKLCLKCTRNIPTVTFSSCKHLCICEQCWNEDELINCPLCKRVISAVYVPNKVSDDGCCVICYTRQVNVTFAKCKHLAICSSCAKGLHLTQSKICMICNNPGKKIIGKLM